MLDCVEESGGEISCRVSIHGVLRSYKCSSPWATNILSSGSHSSKWSLAGSAIVFIFSLCVGPIKRVSGAIVVIKVEAENCIEIQGVTLLSKSEQYRQGVGGTPGLKSEHTVPGLS